MKREFNDFSETVYPDGSIRILANFPFADLRYIRNCICQDGKRRNVKITNQDEMRGHVKVFIKGSETTVTGEVKELDSGFLFIASGKNAHFINRIGE